MKSSLDRSSMHVIDFLDEIETETKKDFDYILLFDIQAFYYKHKNM